MASNVKKKDSIRVNTDTKYIEVNDDGETIAINLADQSLPARFYDMLEDIGKKDKETQQKIDDLKKEDLSENEMHRREADIIRDVGLYFKGKMDSIFGEGACRKVFGDIVPGIDLYQDFFAQVTPYFEKFAKERAKKMNKIYSASRSGNHV